MTKTAKDLIESTKRYHQMGNYATKYEHGKNYKGETDCSHYVKWYYYNNDIVAVADMKYRVLMTNNLGKKDTPFIRSFIEHYADGLHFEHLRFDISTEDERPNVILKRMHMYTVAQEINSVIREGRYDNDRRYFTFEYNGHLLCLVDKKNKVFMTNHCNYVNNSYVDEYIACRAEHYRDLGYDHIICDDWGLAEDFMCYAMWYINEFESVMIDIEDLYGI